MYPKTQVVQVWSDMGHLEIKPSQVSQTIRDQISRDIYTYTKSHRDGVTSMHHDLKPHVPQKRHITLDGSQVIIDYSQLHREASMVRQTIVSSAPETELWVLKNLLSSNECTDLIHRANNMKDGNGNKSWHQPGTGGKYSRVIMIDRKLSDDLWERIRTHLPESLNGYKLLYLNDHFRFSRYKKGGLFPVHCDGKNFDNSRPEITGEYSSESLLTLNIFLNSEEDDTYQLVGGGTSFYNQTSRGLELRTCVKAKAGTAALFWANQYHCGDKVQSGYKYLLRTDVMGIIA